LRLFHPERLLKTVVILAREEVVAALLGLLVELRGFQALYAKKGESADEACARTHCEKIVIDCDHDACAPATLEALQKSGVRVILFSPSRVRSEVQRAAGHFALPTFTLPIGPDAFGKILEG